MFKKLTLTVIALAAFFIVGAKDTQASDFYYGGYYPGYTYGYNLPIRTTTVVAPSYGYYRVIPGHENVYPAAPYVGIGIGSGPYGYNIWRARPIYPATSSFGVGAFTFPVY